MKTDTITHLNTLTREQQAWVLHGRDPAWQLRKLQQVIRRLIKQNNNECPVCTGQAEGHVEECPFGWVLGGPDSWRRY